MSVHCGLQLPRFLGARRQPEIPPILRASEFVLADARGKVRARLGKDTVNDSVGLTLYDGLERLRVTLSVSSGGLPLLTLYGPTGPARFRMEVEPDRGAFVALLDEGGRRRAVLKLAANGVPSLSLLDVAGKAPVSVTLDTGGPRLVLGTGEPGKRVELGVAEAGSSLRLADGAAAVLIIAGPGGPNVSFEGAGQAPLPAER